MSSPWLALWVLLLPVVLGSEQKIKQALEKGKGYEECTESMKGDILFVVDASSSIGVKKFDAMRNFILNMIESEIKIMGPDHIQIGLVLFSHSVLAIIPFDAHVSQEGFGAALTNLTYSRGDTNLGDALRYARTKVMTKENGLRFGVPHIMVIITDGKASDEFLARKEMDTLKKQGVFTLLIGIGEKVDKKKLLQLAPSTSDAIFVERWSGLQSKVAPLARKTCVKISKATHCRKFFKADVVFILDSSTSLGIKNFNILKDFLINVTNAFDVIGPNGTRVALVEFASRVKVKFGLTQFSDKDKLQKALKDVEYIKGSTRTGLALYRAENQILLKRKRDDVNVTIVVLTDGKATDTGSLNYMTKRMHRKKYNIIAVGVGDAEDIDDNQLDSIASSPTETHVFHAADFDALPRFLNLIVTSVCNSNLVFESGQQKLEKKLGLVEEDERR